MSIFKKRTAEDVYRDFSALSAEDKRRLREALAEDDETTEQELDEARRDIREKGKDSQTDKGREDESVAAQERERGQEDSQDASDRIDESEGARRYDEEHRAHEADEALARRLDALEANHKGLTERLERIVEHLETRDGFGRSTETDGTEVDAGDGESAVMRHYLRASRH